jgi:hypothetical protein
MNQNQEPAPPELTPIPIYFNIYDEGELKTQFAIAITPAQIAYLMYGIIPDWLKDSQAAIPMDESKDRDTARSQQALLQTGRIAMKGFVAASGMLLNMGHDLYGANWNMKPREDSLPIVSRWMSWFIAAQVAKAPLEITVENGYIRHIRQVVNIPVQEDNASPPCDNCQGTGER